MDELGRERIPARYLRAAAFAEGRAVVQLAEEPQATAFIDGRGTVLCRLNLAFEDVTFSNERVILGGQVLTPAGQALFEVMGPWGGRDEGFAEGLLNVRKDGAYGFVDINGQEVITPRFAKASPFAEGLAAVAEMSTMADNQGYIDRNGEWVIQPKFSWANSFSDGLAQVRGGYIDKKGTLVISTEQLSRRLCRNPSCEVRTNDFADGLALVEVWDDWDESHDRFFGFIDHTGAVAIAPRFGLASSFSEGLAAAAADGPYGYIDKAGRWVVRPKFGEAGPFVNGLARVSAVAGKKDDEISLLDFLLSLAERKRIIFWITADFAILALVISFLLPVRYTAVVTLLPPQQNSSMGAALISQLGNMGGIAGLAGTSLGLKNPNDMFVGMLKSRTVEDAMVQHFGLMQEYHKRYLSDACKAFEGHATVDGSTKDGLIHISFIDGDPRRAAEPGGRPRQDSGRRLPL